MRGEGTYVEQVSQDDVGFIFREFYDAFRECFVDEYAFPSRDGYFRQLSTTIHFSALKRVGKLTIRPDDRMSRLQVLALVQL